MSTQNAALHQLTLEELEGKLHSLDEERTLLKMQKAAQKLKNTARVDTIGDDIARVKTIMLEKKRAASAQKKEDAAEEVK